MSTSMSTSALHVPEIITIDSIQYKQVREGSVSILAPCPAAEWGAPITGKKSKAHQQDEQTVFYNPIQQFNRDLSVLAILAHGEAALVEKEARHRKKHEQVKRQRENAKKRRSDAGAEAEPEMRKRSDVSKKRKRIDPESGDISDTVMIDIEGESAKRTKIGNLESVHDELQSKQTCEMSSVESHLEARHIPAIENGGPPARKYRPQFTVLDALSATGLRALRYAKEIPFVTRVIANDLSRSAVKFIEKNIEHNDLRGRVCSNVDDARAYMYSKVGNEPNWASEKTIHRFDVIDLDPYGTAAPFFDAAVQALQDGGLLCVTCTDAGVFASNGYPEKAYALYGGIPTKGAHSHEGGLRLILQAIAKCAARYGIAIEPLLSLSIDFYARLFVRVHKQPRDVKLLAGTTMVVYSCDYGCGAWTTQALARNTAKESRSGEAYFKHGYAQGPNATSFCDHCGSKTHLSGPMWAGPIHNPHFVQRILDKIPSLDKEIYATIPRIEGMLTVALEEYPRTDKGSGSPDSAPALGAGYSPGTEDVSPVPLLPPSSIDPAPFFFIPNYLAKVLRCSTPSEDTLHGALRHLSYRTTRSHCKAGSIKTDAPWDVIWEIMREWTRTKMPSKEGAVKSGTAGWGVLARLRGSERARVQILHEEVTQMFKKSESIADTKTVLEAALFRLAREKGEDDGESQQPGVTTTASADFGSPQDSDKRPEKRQTPLNELEIVFNERLGKDKNAKKLCRYQLNPRPNWGPMNRAGGS